ncbi:MAG: hypothetical protein NTV86_13295 [Planctomycetota bacterium]|nr:hypothetical protein [Planctomycetota bacterium]
MPQKIRPRNTKSRPAAGRISCLAELGLRPIQAEPLQFWMGTTMNVIADFDFMTSWWAGPVMIIAVYWWWWAVKQNSKEEQSKKWAAGEMNKWNGLDTGMSTDEVRKILGRPREISHVAGQEVWKYYPEAISGIVTFTGGKVTGFRQPSL